VQGQKYIILVASGRDTFSKLTLDKILKKIKESQNTTIYTISTGGMMRAMGNDNITMLQADNEMKTFSGLTGGASYFPRFQGELPDDFGQINQNIRSKYQLVYHPTNPKQDGTYRKLRVALVDDEGKPLQMQDEKHKQLKYDIIARDGYRRGRKWSRTRLWTAARGRLAGVGCGTVARIELHGFPGPQVRGTGGTSFIKGRAEISESFLFELVDYVEDVIADDDQRHDPG